MSSCVSMATGVGITIFTYDSVVDTGAGVFVLLADGAFIGVAFGVAVALGDVFELTEPEESAGRGLEVCAVLVVAMDQIAMVFTISTRNIIPIISSMVS